MPPQDPYQAVYDRGIAVGKSDVRNDTMTFRWRDEVYEFPLLEVHPLAYYNGYFHEIPVEKLRELKAKKNG